MGCLEKIGLLVFNSVIGLGIVAIIYLIFSLCKFNYEGLIFGAIEVVIILITYFLNEVHVLSDKTCGMIVVISFLTVLIAAWAYISLTYT